VYTTTKERIAEIIGGCVWFGNDALAAAERIAELVATEDTKRLDYMEAVNAGAKWDDALPYLRPVDEAGHYLAKYVGEDSWTVRAAIDARLTQESDS
jgi:hypothetical protein